MEKVKKRLPKGVKVFLWGVFIIYFISGLIVGWSTMGNGEPFHGWLYYWNGPYKGKVVELDTEKPIEGAVVAGSWHLEDMFGLPRFCDAVETTTNKNGEFVLPRAWCISLWPIARLNIPGEQVVFKPGYLAYPPLGSNQEQRRSYMPAFTGHEFENKKEYHIIALGRPKTQLERQLTFDDANNLFDWDEAIKKLPILLKLVNEEGKTLGVGEIGIPKFRGEK